MVQSRNPISPAFKVEAIYRRGGVKALRAVFDGCRGAYDAFAAINNMPRSENATDFLDAEEDRLSQMCESIANYLGTIKAANADEKDDMAAVLSNWLVRTGEGIPGLIAALARVSSLSERPQTDARKPAGSAA
jgi:hypothetical protein